MYVTCCHTGHGVLDMFVIRYFNYDGPPTPFRRYTVTACISSWSHFHILALMCPICCVRELAICTIPLQPNIITFPVQNHEPAEEGNRLEGVLGRQKSAPRAFVPGSSPNPTVDGAGFFGMLHTIVFPCSWVLWDVPEICL